MELMSFTKNVVDVMQEAEESAKKEAQVLSLKPSSEAVSAREPPGPPVNDRPKIVITIQDKAGQKQFRVFAVCLTFSPLASY